MHTLIALGLLVLLAHVAGNVLVARRIAASDYYERRQKRWQIALLWLMPVLGLALAWLCLQAPQQERWSGEDLIGGECLEDDVPESLSAAPASAE